MGHIACNALGQDTHVDTLSVFVGLFRFREETKAWFRKTMVLANVPSFWLLVVRNILMCPRSGFWYWGTSECTLVPVFGTGTSAKTTLLGSQ